MDKNASLLDSLLEQAEVVAEQLRATRSCLDTQALHQHLNRHNADKITRALNQVYLAETSPLDRAWCHLQTHSLPPGRW